MSESPRADAERVLKTCEQEVLGELNSLRNNVAPSPVDGSMGRLSYMDAHQQHQMALHARRQLEHRLDTIRAALWRVKDGSYGACVSCGVTIPTERLEGTPEAPFCIECQARVERTGRV